jgi:hypothetical protein
MVSSKPIPKALYAWNAVHAGSFLLYVESLTDCYKFIFLPGPSEYFLTIEDFKTALKKGMLEFVDVLPDEIYQESLALSCPPGNSTFNT